MDIRKIKKLIEMLQESDLTEIEYIIGIAPAHKPAEVKWLSAAIKHCLNNSLNAPGIDLGPRCQFRRAR